MYFNGADGLFGALCLVHNPEELQLFIDSLKVSLKAERLHNCKIYSPVPLKYCVHIKEFLESLRTLLNCIDCDKCSVEDM